MSDSSEDRQRQESLQKRYDALQKERGLINQELQDIESQYVAAKESETSYVNDIELLKAREASKIKELEHKIKQVKMLISEELESERKNLDNEIVKYEDKLAQLDKFYTEPDESVEEVSFDDALLELLHTLQQDADAKRDQEIEMKMQNGNLKNKYSNIESELNLLTGECDDASSKILESETLLNNFEQELSMNGHELSQPDVVHGNDENSLFAEVNDRRVELRHTLDTLKSKTTGIKEVATIVQKELSDIKYLNQELTNYRKKYEDESRKDLLILTDAYEGHTRTVEYIKKEYLKSIQQQHDLILNGISHDAMEVLSTIEEEKQNAEATIQNKNSAHFRAQKMKSLQLKEVQLKTEEMKRLVANKLEPKVLELKDAIEAMNNQKKQNDEIAGNPSNDKENCVFGDKLEENAKANSKPDVKRVAFSEETAEAKSNNLKRAGKKIHLKSVHISNFMKKN